jgi:archaellum biogenesis protein FlaJ (TadC family)
LRYAGPVFHRIASSLAAAQADLLWGALIALLSFFVSIAAVVLVITRLPEDYFLLDRPGSPVTGMRWTRPLIALARNLGGVVLIAAGVVMSVPGVPGQGILTILIGVMLMDVPGKRGLERKIVRRPRVLKSLNRIRARFAKPALRVD